MADLLAVCRCGATAPMTPGDARFVLPDRWIYEPGDRVVLRCPPCQEAQ